MNIDELMAQEGIENPLAKAAPKIVIDVPGIGPTEFDTKEQATEYFKSKVKADVNPQGKGSLGSYMLEMLKPVASFNLGQGKSLPFNIFNRLAAASGAATIDPILHALRQTRGIEAPSGKSFLGQVGEDYNARMERLPGTEKEIRGWSPEAYTGGLFQGNVAQAGLGYGGIKAGLTKAIPFMGKKGFLPALARIAGGTGANVATNQAMNFGQTGKFAPDQILPSAAFGAGGEVLGEAASLLGRKLGPRLINTALGRPAKVLQNEMNRGETLGQSLYERLGGDFRAGGLNKMGAGAKSNLQKYGNKLDDVLKEISQPGTSLNKETIIGDIKKLRDEFLVPGTNIARAGKLGKGHMASGPINQIDDYLNDIKQYEDITPLQGNRLNRTIYADRGASYDKINNPIGAELDMAQASGVRKAIEDVGKELGRPEISALNKELGINERLKGAINVLRGRDQGKLFNKMNIFRFGGAPVLAGYAGHRAGGEKGALGGFLTTEALATPSGLTRLAALLKKSPTFFRSAGPLYNAIKMTMEESRK